MSIDDKKLEEICKLGQGADCCRYLMVDGSGSGIGCAKNDPNYKSVIDERVKSGKFVARADNCEGE